MPNESTMSATQTMEGRVSVPTFMRKAAEYGLKPRDDDHARQMLDTSILVDRATSAVKAALDARGGDTVKMAMDAMTAAHVDPKALAKTAADVNAAMADQTIRDAALVYFAEQTAANK